MYYEYLNLSPSLPIVEDQGINLALKRSKSSYFRFRCDLDVLVTYRRHVNCPSGSGRIAIDLQFSQDSLLLQLRHHLSVSSFSFNIISSIQIIQMETLFFPLFS